MDFYFPIIQQPAKLRLYLNDPRIKKHLKQDKIPVPLKLEGELLIALGEDNKLHIIFLEPDFMPIFLDLEGSELKFYVGKFQKRGSESGNDL